jgi:hypothetical protein
MPEKLRLVLFRESGRTSLFGDQAVFEGLHRDRSVRGPEDRAIV